MKYIILLIILSGQLFSATAEHQETHSVEPGTIIEVYNVNGNIIINGWDDSKVEINVEKKTSKESSELEKVTFEIGLGEKLMIKTKYLEDDAKVTVNYKINVPSHARIGSIFTSNGDIELAGTAGDAILNTSNGNINIEKNEGSIKARTSNGDVIADKTDMIIEAVTSNGKIKVEIKTLPEDGATIRSSNGSITLYLEENMNANVNASTSNGKVSASNLSFVNLTQNKWSITGTLNEGGRDLNIKTSNGSIILYGFEE